MKNLMLIIPLFLIGFTAQGANLKSAEPLSAYQFIKTLDSKIPVRYPEELKKTKIKNLKVNKNTVSFIMGGNALQITLVGQQERFLIINGLSFSHAELRDFKTIQSSLVKKFHLKKPQYSLISTFFSFAHAEEYLPFSRLPISSVTPVSGDTSGNSTVESVNSSAQQTNQFGFGNFNGLMGCLTGVCFKQGLVGISSFLEALTNFGTNDRAFNEYFSMPVQAPTPTFNASPYSVR